jgi:hypothetical protein
MFLRLFWVAACAASCIAAPASATKFTVTAIGTLAQSPAPNQTLNDLPFGVGSGIVGSWTVNIAKGTPVSQTPPGSPTTGEAKLIFGAVTKGFLTIQSSGGNIDFNQTANSLGALYALNNVSGGSGRLLDQLTLTDGTRTSQGGLVTGMANDTGGFLPPGVFLGSVSFGRSAGAPTATPPTLLTSLDSLDPFTLWQTGPYVFGVNFRSGTATTQAEYLALPMRSFNVTTSAVFVEPVAAVPEAATWAMLIIGFGAVGTVMRRRRLAENCG